MNRRQTPSSDMDRLQTNYSFLLEEIDAMVLVPKLFELRVITRHDKEAIQIQAQSQNTKAGTDKLLDILFRSGNNPYKGFMESLSINGYHHVVRRLELDVNNQSPETVDAKYNTQQQTINSLIQSNTKQQQTINKQQQSNNKQQQTINKQQQDINALTQSHNQLKEEFQSFKEEVRCIKQQLGAQRTETPTNNEKDNRPISWEQMLPKERKGYIPEM